MNITIHNVYLYYVGSINVRYTDEYCRQNGWPELTQVNQELENGGNWKVKLFDSRLILFKLSLVKKIIFY